MKQKAPSPIGAFDILDGRAEVYDAPWPSLDVSQGYRWLHFDLDDPETGPWVAEALPDIAAHALLQSETRPRCERLGDGLILNLRGVNLNPESDPEDMVSLRLWVTKDAVVSALKRKVFAVDTIRQAAEAGRAPISIGKFLSDIVYGLTRRIETVSLGLEEETDQLEDAIGDGHRVDLAKLGRLRQAVIKMRRFINPQRDAIAALSDMEGWVIGAEELALIRETSNRTRRVVEELDATRDRLSTIQDQLDAAGGLALSRNSYVLSVVAAIFLPLGFLTGLFGVNVAGMPGMTEPLAFWTLSGASVLVGIALFLIFKLSKWL